MTAEKTRRTFISYSRINKEFAVKFAKELRATGYNIWLDQLDIPTGARWDDALESALQECEIFLVVLTPASIASENVKDEIGYAIDHGKQILPILLEECDVPLRLRRFQYVDFTKLSYAAGLNNAKELLTGFGSKLSTPAATTDPATEPKKADGTSAPQAAKPAAAPKKAVNNKLIVGIAIGVIILIALGIGASVLLKKKATPTALSATSTPQATTQSGQTAAPTSSIPAGFMKLTDTAQALTVVVPDTWTDTASGETNGTYLMLKASSDLNLYDAFLADGITMYASKQMTWSYDEELDSFNILTNATTSYCTLYDEVDYLDQYYQGKVRQYSCTLSGNTDWIYVYAVRPISNPDSYLISMQVQIVSDDMTYAGNLLGAIEKSFDVINSQLLP